MRRSTRGADVATRLDGAEFAMVLRDTDRIAALAVAERLRAAVREEFTDLPVPVSVSIGLAATARTSTPPPRYCARRTAPSPRRGASARTAPFRTTPARSARSTGSATVGGEREAGAGAGEQLAAAMLLAETLDLRDRGTARHAHTVGQLAEQTGRHLGWDADRLERLHAAGVLHDIGKLGIPDAILQKPGALDADEWREIRRHPEIGARSSSTPTSATSPTRSARTTARRRPRLLPASPASGSRPRRASSPSPTPTRR